MCDIILQPSPSDETPQQAEIRVKVPRKVLTVTERSTSYEQAVHNAVDLLSRQLKRYKEKMHATN
jgi:putative sigma-54 modulation protein